MKKTKVSEEIYKLEWYTREKQNLINWIMRGIEHKRWAESVVDHLILKMTGQPKIYSANIFALQIVQNTLRQLEATCKSPK